MRFAICLLVFALPCLAEEEAEKVFRTCNPSVVGLENLETSGTGIIVSTGGLILTNAHVLSSPLKYRVLVDVPVSGGGTKTVVFTNPKIVGFHPSYDLALLRINVAEHPDVHLAPAKILRAKGGPGKRVYAIGNPAISGMTLTKSITDGMLSAVDREMDGLKYYQFSAPINPGNSGGPLLDKDGGVLGLVTFKMTDADGVGFAIPLHDFDPAKFVPLGKGRGNVKLAQDLTRESQKYHELGDRIAASKGKDNKDALACRYIAFLLLREALLELPGDPVTWSNVALAYRKLDEPAIATAYYLRSLAIDPWWGGNSDIYQTVGMTLIDQKQPENAEFVWLEGTAKYPFGTGHIWFNAAVSDMQAQHWEDVAYHVSCALVSGGGVKADCDKLLAEARSKLSPDALKKLDERLANVAADLDKLQKSSAAAQKAKKAFLTPAFEKFLKSYEDTNGMPTDDKGVGKEEGGADNPASPPDAPPPPAADAPAKWIASKLNMARSFHKNAVDDKALLILQEILDKYPDHPDSKEAKRLLEEWKRK